MRMSQVTRSQYEAMSIIDKLSFWIDFPVGSALHESWNDINSWADFVREVCLEARTEIQEGFATWLQEAVERGKKIGPTTDKFLSVTGEDYVELHSTKHITKKEAVNAGLYAFQAYEMRWRAAHPNEDPVLYWRILPETDYFEGEWKVYMRCLLSAKPPLDPQSLSQLSKQRNSSLK